MAVFTVLTTPPAANQAWFGAPQPAVVARTHPLTSPNAPRETAEDLLEPAGQVADLVGSPAATIVRLDELPTIDCPCGTARRAFADQDEFPGTIHLTNISAQARTHYHKKHTEVYVVLECSDDAQIELDGQRHPVRPHTSILIPPGVRHRAIGHMTVLIICQPNFDPEDEFFD